MVGFKEFLGLLLAVSAGHIMYQRLTGGPALTQNSATTSSLHPAGGPRSLKHSINLQ